LSGSNNHWVVDNSLTSLFYGLSSKLGGPKKTIQLWKQTM